MNFSKEKLLECKKFFKQQNNAWESANMGNYRLVFSEENAMKYKHYFYCNENSLYRNICRPKSRQELQKEMQKNVGIFRIIFKTDKFTLSFRERFQLVIQLKKPAKSIVQSVMTTKNEPVVKQLNKSVVHVKPHDVSSFAIAN